MPRTAIIAFDSLDFGLARQWADAGELPVFRDLFHAGAWSMVRNPEGFEAGDAWMSFITGVGPGDYGIYDAFYRFDPSTYRIGIATPSDTGCEPFWSRASRAGRRLAIVDVPYSFVDPQLNGVHIADWLVHATSDTDGPKTSSPEALREILELGTNPLSHPVNRCAINEQDVHSAEGLSRVVEIEEQRVEWKTRHAAQLLSRNDWDLFMTVFHEAHDLGHMCWHAHDPTHDWHDASVAAAVGDPLLRIYKKLDAATGELIAAAPADCRVLVYSSHGIGPERTAGRLLDDLLIRLEAAGQPAPGRGWLERAGGLYHKVVPAALRRRFFAAETVKSLWEEREHERRRYRRCVALSPAYSTGGIHLNIRGRESHGLLEPGRPSEEFVAWLKEQLLQLQNAETGEPLVLELRATDELQSGPARDLLPDLLLSWNMCSPIRKVRVPQLDTVLDNRPSVRSGDHASSKEGFLIVSGHASTSGQHDPIRVQDLTATLAERLEDDTSVYHGSAVPWIAS